MTTVRSSGIVVAAQPSSEVAIGDVAVADENTPFREAIEVVFVEGSGFSFGTATGVIVYPYGRPAAGVDGNAVDGIGTLRSLIDVRSYAPCVVGKNRVQQRGGEAGAGRPTVFVEGDTAIVGENSVQTRVEPSIRVAARHYTILGNIVSTTITIQGGVLGPFEPLNVQGA